jgi:DnaJ-class molecular chaperone
MPRKRKKELSLSDMVKDLDKLSRMVTGKSAYEVGSKIMEILGPSQIQMPIIERNPVSEAYYTLGIHEGASDLVVKAVYRELAREYHPDTGKHPDGTRMREINSAYELITKERQK